MDIQFAAQAYERSQYALPVNRCENMFAEEAPSEPSRAFTLLSAPGMKAFATTTGSVGQGLFRSEGLLGGDLYAVSSGSLDRIDASGTVTALGTVGTTGLARFAPVRGFLGVLCGTGTPYLYNGTNLTAITDVDIGSNVRDIAGINGRMLFATGNDEFYWSEVLDPDNIDALSFATAERAPDDLKAIVINQQEIWLMGGSTCEAYYDAGGVDVFIPLGGGLVERGILTRDAHAVEDNTIFWVGDDRVVYRFEQYLPVRVSTHFIEDKLDQVAAADIENIKMWSYSQAGHKFIGLRVPGDKTYVYDIATQTWHSRKTRGQANYRVIECQERQGRVFAIDEYSGNVLEIDPDTYTDSGEEIERVISAYVATRSNIPVQSFVVDCTKGIGDAATPEPTALLRYSDNQGRTWSGWRGRSLGKIGEYAKKVIWRILGRITPPGRIFELRITDPVNVAIYGARMNDVDS